ncbi:hypothetical protein [Leifsonia sp. NPDC058230]|uniref:hypothetical protein n=1 Tax=Leifsonia sp. NPDC058230 TaxID=3346391 RepID=UPI0036D95807
MNKNATSSAFAAAAVLAAVFALTGCTADGPSNPSTTAAVQRPPATQTHEEACGIVNDGLQAALALRDRAGEVVGDPAKASALMDELADKVKTMDEKIGNADVVKVVSDARNATDEFAKYIRDAISNPLSVDVTKVQTKAEELGAKYEAVQKECA